MDNKELLIGCGIFVVFLAVMFGSFIHSDNNRLECRQHGIQQGLSASDIQAICK